MKQHPYLRAYLAGIAAPTCFTLVALTVFLIARFACHIPMPIERLIIFPMALVPNLFGVWNMLYLGLHRHRYLPLGLHGALLPLLLIPSGFLLATALGFLRADAGGLTWFESVHISYTTVAMIFPLPLLAYYLIWKYLVGFLNQMLGIA